MKTAISRLTTLFQRAPVVPLAVLLLSFGAAIWFLSADARREIEALATANTDSTQWSLAQTEVEFLQLKIAAQSAAPDDADALRNLRRRFDVFYSRVATIKTSPTFAALRARVEIDSAIVEVDRFLQDSVSVIDGSDAVLGGALETMQARIESIEDEVRTIDLAGVQVFSEESDGRRERVAAALFDLASMSILLIGVILAFVFVLVRLLNSSRNRAEKLQSAESRLGAIAASSLDAILVVGRDGRVLEYNGAAANIFGYSREEVIGQQMAELIVPDHLRDAHNAGMQRHLETGEERVIGKGRVQLEAKDKSGRVFPVEVSISTADSKDGEIFVSFLRDISRRVAAERELIEARDKAVAGEKAKAELLAIMSHEMRTPLNGVLGALQLLEKTSLDDRQREFIGVMETSGQMLLRHVNAVLDISRSEAGIIEPASVKFDPEDTVISIVRSLDAQADARGNRLEVRSAGRRLERVLGDESLLRQVLTNLIGNAIKFTENGTITVEYERLVEEDLVEFRVSDTGIGIGDEDQTRIFEDFVTLDSSFSRKVEGTGLGLGIVRRLVSVMHGEIGVESVKGEGSVFWFRVPMPQSNDAAFQAPIVSPGVSKSPSTHVGASVLLVEDNKINRIVANGMLSEMGCDVTEANDGQEGIQRASERQFDLILMDISMPSVDGVEATGVIRSGGGPNASTPIIALTAHALPGDIEKFHAAGMSDVVIKPIERSQLASALLNSQAMRAQMEPEHLHGDDEEDGGLLAAFDPQMSHRIAEMAHAEISNGLMELTRGINQDGDVSTLRGDIHKLVGVAAMIGERELRDVLARAEEAAANGEQPALTEHMTEAVAVFQKSSFYQEHQN